MNSRIVRGKNIVTQKPVSFIAPGQLAKDRGFGNKSSNVAPGQLAKGFGYGNKSSNVAYGSRRISAVDEYTNGLHSHGTTGGNSVHNIILHYGEVQWKERNITEESSFMDLLAMCKRFIDIYSVGFRITDGDGRPLRDDKDVLAMFKEHEDVENILVYLDVDETLQPLLFKLPEDNPSLVSVPRDSQVGDVIMEDSNGSEPIHHNTRKNVEDSATNKVRKSRGMNQNIKVISLKRGEKLEIQFHNNRGVGPNHKCWSRHLGRIVRDRNICPVRVYTWKEMTNDNKRHMWAMVKECFSNPDMELYRKDTLEHMDALWTAWRSGLDNKYVKSCKTKALALKNVPPQMDVKDWEWLVTHKFSDEKFKERSSRNSENRAKQTMHHRTGSQPHRQIIYEMETATNTTPNIAEIFFATRQKKGKLVNPTEQEKYDEIVKTVQADASLSPIEVLETCFGPQNHSHVFGFGGGVKRKHLKEPEAAQIKELKGQLHGKEEENNDLRRCLEEIESRLTRMENGNRSTSAEPQAS